MDPRGHRRSATDLTAVLRSLVAPDPHKDYECSMCFWCGGGWEAKGRRMTLNHREVIYTGAHGEGCPFAAARRMLGGPESGEWPLEDG
jgi:hypothetical protein